MERFNRSMPGFCYQWLTPELKCSVFGLKVARMQGAEKFATSQVGGFYPKHYLLATLAQVSLSVTVRLKTGFSGVLSFESRQK